jgi:hypothetical protein
VLHQKYESLLTATLQYSTTTTKEMKRIGFVSIKRVYRQRMEAIIVAGK